MSLCLSYPGGGEGGRMLHEFLYLCRAEASLTKLTELNPYVTVQASTSPLNVSTDLSFLDKFQVGGSFALYSCERFEL